MPRARKKPIPVTIVVGPRGAGKTTLINRMLGDKAFADTAVILNDFGGTALKNAIVEKAEDGFISLGSGCVCCTVRGALTDGLENLLRGVDNGRIAAIGRVVIEADAAADPSAILAAVERHPYLSLRFEADSIVAVLDATTAIEVLAARADTVRQLAMADVIVLSRAAAGDAVRRQLHSLNPGAPVVDATSVASAELTGHCAFDPAIDDAEEWLGQMRPVEASPPLAGEAGRIVSFVVTRDHAIPFAALDRFLGYLWALQGPNLIRVRGLVATDENETVVVDGTGASFRPPQILDRGVAAPQTRFAVAARDLSRASFEGYLDAFLNEARVDMPDRQALTDNPLVVPGFSARSGR